MLNKRSEFGNLIAVENEVDFLFSICDHEAERSFRIRSANGNLCVGCNAGPISAAGAILEPEEEVSGALHVFGWLASRWHRALLVQYACSLGAAASGESEVVTLD